MGDAGMLGWGKWGVRGCLMLCCGHSPRMSGNLKWGKGRGLFMPLTTSWSHSGLESFDAHPGHGLAYLSVAGVAMQNARERPKSDEAGDALHEHMRTIGRFIYTVLFLFLLDIVLGYAKAVFPSFALRVLSS